MERASGVLLPIFSLPSDLGVGDFGFSAYKFIDFLKRGGQKFWQILPLVQTGLGNSPYSSVCSYSFNPYFISPELLKKENLISKSDLSLSINKSKKVDYGFLYEVRYSLLKTAFNNFDKNLAEFVDFVNKGEFKDYALFMALKERYNYAPFYEWADGYKNRDQSALDEFIKNNLSDYLFWQFVQFEGQKQWLELKNYANKKGVSIIGDLPLYVALDSVDVWANPSLFKLNNDFTPKKVAGVPPDYFCEDGQLWGNPVYDYSNHQKDDFSWWSNRILRALTVYDYIRIDHFRGLDRYYEVEPTAQNAKVGEWIDVPSEELFNAIHNVVDKSKIIAEDLGIIDDGVRELLAKTGYPGMKILSFAFNGDQNNAYLPESLPKNSICYTGTHDNDTLIGLISSANEWDKNNLICGVKSSLEKFNLSLPLTTDKDLAKAIIRLGYISNSNLFVLPMQDLLALNSDCRVNTPGVVSTDNWVFRLNERQLKRKYAKTLKTYAKNSNRI